MSALQLMSTYWDAIQLFPQLWDKEDQVHHEASPQEIRGVILQSDGEIRTRLRNLYPGDLSMTPWVGMPFRPRGFSGTGQLLLTDNTNSIAIADNANVHSGIYKFVFSAATVATVTHDVFGDQGALDTTADFTSTDTYLTIPKELWTGTFAADDIVIVKIYEHEPMLVRLSALLTTVTLLDALFTDESPNAATTSQKYQRAYNDLMKALLNEEAFLAEGLASFDISPIQVDYEIDEYGADVTNYADYEWDPAKGMSSIY
jgi:hypothetical protein